LMGAVSVVYDLTETKQGTWGGGRHHRRAFSHHAMWGPRWWRGCLLPLPGLQGEWFTHFCPTCHPLEAHVGDRQFVPASSRCSLLHLVRLQASGSKDCTGRGPHTSGCSAGSHRGTGLPYGFLPLMDFPNMGSGSFLGRKMLVHFPDIFLSSPQFLHRAFHFRIKSISVNKSQKYVCSNF